jgi:predicted nucleotide-binding protein
MPRQNHPPSAPSAQPTVPPEEGIKFLKRRILKAKDISSGGGVKEDSLKTWINTTVACIEAAFGKNHRNVHDFLKRKPDLNGMQIGCANPEDFVRSEILDFKIEGLREYIEELEVRASIRTPNTTKEPTFIENRPVALSHNPSKDPSGQSKKIFIVHGHAGELKEATARLLTRLDLEPVILHEQSDRGLTIIEKFSAHAKESGFAVVLLTADDVGSKGTVKSHSTLKLRARQNVVFEMGFFFGSLGRGRVCAIFDQDIEMPSDLGGILYVPYDPSGSWRLRVAKEIRAAGYDVDLNRL